MRVKAIATFLGGVWTGIYIGRAWVSAERLLEEQTPAVSEMLFEAVDVANPLSRGPAQTLSPEFLALEEVR